MASAERRVGAGEVGNVEQSGADRYSSVSSCYSMHEL
jgi:hypothetical protein